MAESLFCGLAEDLLSVVSAGSTPVGAIGPVAPEGAFLVQRWLAAGFWARHKQCCVGQEMENRPCFKKPLVAPTDIFNSKKTASSTQKTRRDLRTENHREIMENRPADEVIEAEQSLTKVTITNTQVCLN